MNTKQADLRLTSPATYRILRTLWVARDPLLQKEVAAIAQTSPGRVSQVMGRLQALGYVKRGRDGRYRVEEVATIPLTILPFQRRMDDTRVGRVLVRGGKEQVKKAVVEAGGILNLETALEEKSSYFRADRVSCYHEDPQGLLEDLSPHAGGNLPVDVYAPDIPLDGDTEDARRTTKWRTVIDLACDGKTYVAKDFLHDLWGIVLE